MAQMPVIHIDALLTPKKGYIAFGLNVAILQYIILHGCKQSLTTTNC